MAASLRNGVRMKAHSKPSGPSGGHESGDVPHDAEVTSPQKAEPSLWDEARRYLEARKQASIGADNQPSDQAPGAETPAENGKPLRVKEADGDRSADYRWLRT